MRIGALSTPTTAINHLLAELITDAGFAALFVQLLATVVALRSWTSAHTFAVEVRDLVREETHWLAYEARLATLPPEIPGLMDPPLPVSYGDERIGVILA